MKRFNETIGDVMYNLNEKSNNLFSIALIENLIQVYKTEIKRLEKLDNKATSNMYESQVTIYETVIEDLEKTIKSLK